MIDQADVATLVQALKDNADRLGLTWTMSAATVADPATPTVIFDSDTTSTAVPVVNLVALPLAGDRVYVVSLPPAGNYMIGRVPQLDPSRFGSCTYAPANPGSGTTVSVTFANLPGNPSCTIVKAYDATRLKVSAFIATFSTLANTAVDLGVSCNSVDTFVWHMVHNPANTHDAYGATIFIPAAGLPAGTYTVTGRWRRSAGGGTITMNADDFFNMTVEEVI